MVFTVTTAKGHNPVHIGSVTNHQKQKLYWETRCGRKTIWKYGLCCPLMTLRTYLGVKEIDLVELVHLLQEDEGKNCVRPKTSVIRSETLPQTEESFFSYDLHQYLLKKEKEKVKKNERKAVSVRDYTINNKNNNKRTFTYCTSIFTLYLVFYSV